MLPIGAFLIRQELTYTKVRAHYKEQSFIVERTMSPYRPKYPLFLWRIQSFDGTSHSNRCITTVSPAHLLLMAHESLAPKPNENELKEIFFHYVDAHVRTVNAKFPQPKSDTVFTLEEVNMEEKRYKGLEYATDIPALSRTLSGKWYLIRERHVPHSEFFY